MGANVSSSVLWCTDGGEGVSSTPSLGDIPESCVALVLMNLDPIEICKLACLNRAFHGKKDLYSRLCRPNSFDAGTKEIWLDKKSGGICVFISSKALTITGIDDRRYWTHISTHESRMGTAAYLQQIWWVEIDGEIELEFPIGTYSLFFRLQLGRSSKRMGRRVCNTEHIHGWDIKPVRFELTTSDSQQAVSQCFLDISPGNWVSCHVGDFVVENANVGTKVKFSFTQIDCTHIKGGLCLDGVYIRPNTCSLARETECLSIH